MSIAMSAIHMPIEIAKTIFALFQMAILLKVYKRLDLGGWSYHRNTRTFEE